MPEFKRPGTTLKEKTSGGFDKPAVAPKQARTMLEKKSISEELSINDLHLNEEIMGQPLLMRKYTQELSKLRKKCKSIKNQLELKEARLAVKFANDGKGKRVSEIEASIIQDDEVQKLRIELYDAEELQDEYEGIVRSIAQRMDALKDLSANIRKELL